MGSEADLHVMMFPWFAFGHISPFLQLARKISSTARRRTIRITFLSAPSNVPRIASLLPSSPSVNIVSLQIPHVDGLPAGAESTATITPAMAELLKQALDLMKPQVASLLADHRPQLVFHDFAQPWLPSIAEPLNIKTIFFPVFAAVSTAFLMSPSRRLHGPSPTIDHLRLPPENFPTSSSITSVPTYQAEDFLYVFKSFGGAPCLYNRVVPAMEACSAIVAKTCMEMEGKYTNYVESQYGKPVLLTGPGVPEPAVGELEEKWAEWLGGFGEDSVVFCSFGSETFLTDDAVMELVMGLEMTGLPFLLVLNFPGGGGVEGKLPEGFEERLEGRGKVHCGWVQQQHILGHKSVGCFVCHAGLSSVMEGMVAGCQLVTLPQKGDQYLNSRLFTGDLEVGVEVVRDDGDGRFTREGICEAVRVVMVEGEEGVGKRVRENHGRWRKFLMDKGVQEKFTEDLIVKLEAMAAA
uniref:Glycosyltransferase n=1 Tax=Lilium hybrid cultivar TaxID=156531 RepID=A0A7S9YVL7_9LILI|nr:anthocyanidin-3-glucoside rhamnosyltransferase [Lilium hybrid cultivar]